MTLALKAFKPSTIEKQRHAESRQAEAAKKLKGSNTPNNDPFDIVRPDALIEVKTMVDNSNDKITVHPESRKRKEAAARKAGKPHYTVVIDDRDEFMGGKNKAQFSGNKIYWRKGVGAFELRAMNKAASWRELNKVLAAGGQ